MPFDFPQTPGGRWGLYIDALRHADPKRQCFGDFVVINGGSDQRDYLGCAMTMIIHTVFGISMEDIYRQSVPAVTQCAQVQQDLVAMGFDANWIMRMNDNENASFNQIAELMANCERYVSEEVAA